MNRIPRFALAAGLFASLAGLASAQSGAVTPPPEDAATSVSSSSMWTITTSDDGRTIKLEGKNGVITAEIDGKAIPADRIVREGNTVRIKDDKGEVIFEQDVPAGDASTRTYTWSGPGAATGKFDVWPKARISHGSTLGGNWNATPRSATMAVQADPPKAMIGVQLLEPDASLRGHLGLKEGETTMISAIYEGFPADHAGLVPYDIIVSVDGKTPASPAAVREALHDKDAGQSVKLEIIHQGQKKTITLSPEKYDREKLDKAKINAIAAASGTPESPFGDALHKSIAEAIARAGGGGAGQPFVATFPGGGKEPHPMILWNNQQGMDMQALAQHMQEMAAQAEHAQEQAEQMRMMEERMKKMEEMMQKLLERQGAKPEQPKNEGRS